MASCPAMTRACLLVLPLLLSTACATLGRPEVVVARRPFGTVREQAERQQRWLRERLEVVLPRLMRLHHVELWVVPVSESHEDPVFQALAGPTTLSARRRTLYVFHRTPEGGVERWVLGGGSEGGLYEVRHSQRRVNPGTGPREAELWGSEQWQHLKQLVEELQPRAIAINTSRMLPLADGLSHGEHEALVEALGPAWASRLVPAEGLALDVLAWRSEDEGRVFEQLHQLASDLLATALSHDVIHPGQTRASDVAWWLRQRVMDLGLGVWFHPEVEVQRAVTGPVLDEDPVIQRGDVLHCRLGLKALGLHSETQRVGYVLREGEKDAPEGLQRLLRQVHRIQDLLLEEVGVGRQGNDVLRYTFARVDAENLEAIISAHPMGLHGHGAGALIGLWDWQQGVPGPGDVRVRPDMWFGAQVRASAEVPEWYRQRVGVALEEGLILDASGTPRWVRPLQRAFHLVR